MAEQCSHEYYRSNHPWNGQKDDYWRIRSPQGHSDGGRFSVGLSYIQEEARMRWVKNENISRMHGLIQQCCAAIEYLLLEIYVF